MAQSNNPANNQEPSTGASLGPRIGFLLVGVSDEETIADIASKLLSLNSVLRLDPPTGQPPQTQFNGYAVPTIQGDPVDEISEELLLLPGFRTTIQGIQRLPFTIFVFTAVRGTPDQDAVETRRQAEETRKATDERHVGVPRVAGIGASPVITPGGQSQEGLTRPAGRKSSLIRKVMGFAARRKAAQPADDRDKGLDWAPGQVAQYSSDSDIGASLEPGESADSDALDESPPASERVIGDEGPRISDDSELNLNESEDPIRTSPGQDLEWSISVDEPESDDAEESPDAGEADARKAIAADQWAVEVRQSPEENTALLADSEELLGNENSGLLQPASPIGSSNLPPARPGSSLPSPLPDLFAFPWFSSVSTMGLILVASIVAVGYRVAQGGVFPESREAMGHLYRVRYLAEQIRGGQFLPQWTPDWYMGAPLFEYYPPAITYFLGPMAVIAGTSAAYKLFILFAIPLAGVFTALLFRKFLGLPGAIVAGLLFSLSPWLIRTVFFSGQLPIIMVAILLPVGLRIMIDLFELPTVRRFLFMTLFSMILVLGDQFVSAMFFMATTAGLAVSTAVRYKNRSSGLYSVLAAMLLGLGISGWFLVPRFMRDPGDGVGGLGDERLLTFSNTNSLFDLSGRGDLGDPYIGLGMVSLALLGFVFRRREPLVHILGSIVVVAVFMSYGLNNSINRGSDLLQSFQFFDEFLIIGSLALALLAGLLVKTVVDKVPNHVDPVLPGGAAVIAVLALIWVDSGPYFSSVQNSDHQELINSTRDLDEASPPGRFVDFTGRPELSYFPSLVGRNVLGGWEIESTSHADRLSNALRAIRLGHTDFAARQFQQWWVAGAFAFESDVEGRLALQESGFVPLFETAGNELWTNTATTSIALRLERNATVIGRATSATLASWPWMNLTQIPIPDGNTMGPLADQKLVVIAEIQAPLDRKFEAQINAYLKNGGNAVVFLTNNDALWSGGVETERRSFTDEMLLIDVSGRVISEPELVRGFSFRGQGWESLVVNDENTETIFAVQDSAGIWFPILSKRNVGDGSLYIVGGSSHVHGFDHSAEPLMGRISEFLALEIEGLYTESTLPIAPALEISLDGGNVEVVFDAGPGGGQFVISITDGPRWGSFLLDNVGTEVESYEGLILISAPPGIHRFTMSQSATSAMWLGRVTSVFALIALVIVYQNWHWFRRDRISIRPPERVATLFRRFADTAFGSGEDPPDQP